MVRPAFQEVSFQGNIHDYKRGPSMGPCWFTLDNAMRRQRLCFRPNDMVKCYGEKDLCYSYGLHGRQYSLAFVYIFTFMYEILKADF